MSIGGLTPEIGSSPRVEEVPSPVAPADDAPPRRGVLDRDWERVKTRTIFFTVASIGIIVALSIAAAAYASVGWLLACVFVGLALGVIGLTVYRCPSCGGYPGWSRVRWFPRHCASCGTFLG